MIRELWERWWNHRSRCPVCGQWQHIGMPHSMAILLRDDGTWAEKRCPGIAR